MTRPAAALVLAGLLLAGPALAVELRLEPTGRPVPGAPTALVLHASDPTTGWPLDGLGLRAWLRTPLRPDENCEKAAGALALYGPAPRQAIALDGQRFLSLGGDATLGVIDPRTSLATANLARVDQLGAVPAELVLDPARARLWATVPATDRVLRRDLAAGLDLGALTLPGGPRALLRLPAGSWLVGLDQGAVVHLDEAGRVLGRAELGSGPVELAALPDGERVLALARGGGRLALLTLPDLRTEASLVLPRGAAALALVAEQELGLVVHDQTLSIVALDRAMATLGKVALGIAPDRILPAPGGRFAFLLDRGRSTLAVVDLATVRLVHALSFQDGAEELALGDDSLFVRLRDAGAVAALRLATLVPDGPSPVIDRIVMGDRPTGGAGDRLLTPVPGGGLLLAHPADRMIYLFTGGDMRAQANAFPVKTAPTRRLLVQDLRPVAQGRGRYATAVALPGPGRYQLVALVDRPAEAHCLALDVPADAAGEAAAPPLVRSTELTLTFVTPPGGAAPSAVELVARPAAGRPRDLAVMAVRSGDSWWDRPPLEALGDGLYRAPLRLPGPGRYVIMAEAGSAGVHFGDGPRLTLTIGPEAVP